MDISGDFKDFFRWVHGHYESIHIEEGSAGVYETAYERKEGRFVCNRDKLEGLKCRYGLPNGIQKEFLRVLDTQSVREIDVWYDPTGCHGKSWFAVHMADTGKALYVPSSQSTPANLESFIVHNWAGEDFIIIDIPRAAKVPPDLYEVLERIKDGWLVSTKWQGKSANVRGTKLAVFTNTKLDTKKLSHDRWRLHGIGGTKEPS